MFISRLYKHQQNYHSDQLKLNYKSNWAIICKVFDRNTNQNYYKTKQIFLCMGP